MGKVTTLLGEIADAIRERLGTQNKIPASEFASEIAKISDSGKPGSVTWDMGGNISYVWSGGGAVQEGATDSDPLAAAWYGFLAWNDADHPITCAENAFGAGELDSYSGVLVYNQALYAELLNVFREDSPIELYLAEGCSLNNMFYYSGSPSSPKTRLLYAPKFISSFTHSCRSMFEHCTVEIFRFLDPITWCSDARYMFKDSNVYSVDFTGNPLLSNFTECFSGCYELTSVKSFPADPSAGSSADFPLPSKKLEFFTFATGQTKRGALNLSISDSPFDLSALRALVDSLWTVARSPYGTISIQNCTCSTEEDPNGVLSACVSDAKAKNWTLTVS